MTDTQPDPVVASIGLPRHQKPKVLAQYLRAVANRIEADGPHAIRVATILASRGFGSGTLGDGGSRSTDGTSSVERAAGVTSDTGARPKFADADRTLAASLRLIWQAGLSIESQLADLLSHGDDVDVLPPGTGNCECCEVFVRPTGERPDFRLRAGLCPACHKAYGRAGGPDRGAWIIQRRQDLRSAFKSGKAPADIVRLIADGPDEDLAAGGAA